MKMNLRILVIFLTTALACNLTNAGRVEPTQTLSPITPIVLPQDVSATPTLSFAVVGEVTTPQPTFAQPSNCINKIGAIEDATYPDDALVDSGEVITKTWKLHNDGTCTWTPDYALVFVADQQMNGVSPMPLGITVLPGGVAEVSISLTTPLSAGNHRSLWMMQDSSGTRFGTGGTADAPFWVQLIVNSNAEQTANLPNPEAGESLGNVSPLASVDLKSNITYYSGVCPLYVKFTTHIKANRKSPMDYHLELVTDQPDTTLQAPPQKSYSFSEGEMITEEYTIQFVQTATGWARMRILSPTEILSDKVNYSVTCR